MKYLLLLILVGCGVNGHVDPVTVNPIAVTVTIKFPEIFNMCSTGCIQDPDPTTCTETCYANFIKSLGLDKIKDQNDNPDAEQQ